MHYFVHITDDLRFAFRHLRRSLGFAVIVIGTLALAIGANTAIFSVVNALLIRPLPYTHPERLGTMVSEVTGAHASPQEPQSWDGEMWEAVNQQAPAAEAAAAGMPTGVNMQAGAGPAAQAAQYIQNLRVSQSFFHVLGLQPILGRTFTADEDRPNGPNVAILSNALWKNSFAANPAILGQSISLKGEPYTIIGVMPAGIHTPHEAAIWTPLRPSLTGEGAGTNYESFVRLRPGATWLEANTQLARIRASAIAGFEKQNPGSHITYQFVPLQQGQASELRTPVLALMLAVSFILLIACANLAGLTLVRVFRRSGEIATRLALGATRWAILRQLWTENLLLAVLGGGCGIVLAVFALRGLNALLPPDLLPVSGVDLDLRVLAFTFAASVLTSIFFGMLPALVTRRVDLRSSMSGGNRNLSYAGSNRVRQALIAGEVALTVVLLAASGLLIRTISYLEHLPPGFDPHNVMTAKLSLDDARYHDPAKVNALFTRSLSAMEAIPGVESAAVGLSLPYERGLNNGLYLVDGKEAGTAGGSSMTYITPGYFRTLRIPLLAGRELTPADTAGSQPVAVVNQAFAKRFFHADNPIGRHIGPGGKPTTGNASGTNICTIVGVVGNIVKTPGMEGAGPLSTEAVVYISAAQAPARLLNLAHVWFQPSWMVRTSHPVTGLTEQMQSALASADPSLPFSGFYAMGDLLAQALAMQRIEVTLLSTLALLALALSAVGIFGLVSNLVVQRTREIGIRIALGSTIQEAMISVGLPAIISAGLGLAAGLLLSAATLRALRSAIYGVHPYDPVTLAAAILLLALIAVTATALPTLRVARIDPATTLREE